MSNVTQLEFDELEKVFRFGINTAAKKCNTEISFDTDPRIQEVLPKLKFAREAAERIEVELDLTQSEKEITRQLQLGMLRAIVDHAIEETGIFEVVKK